jgi:hypothetical protein
VNGGYMSLAEAVGEAPPSALAFVAGVDFDPSDPDEVAIVRLASERDYHDRMGAEVRRLVRQRDTVLEALRRADPDAAEQFEEW